MLKASRYIYIYIHSISVYADATCAVYKLYKKEYGENLEEVICICIHPSSALTCVVLLDDHGFKQCCME